MIDIRPHQPLHPPFTTDGVATPTSSQEVSLHSGKPNLEIGTQQTQQTHLHKPTSHKYTQVVYFIVGHFLVKNGSFIVTQLVFVVK